MNYFELGKILYEARVREAWGFSKGHAEARLAAHPYPRHPADADPARISAEAELAMARDCLCDQIEYWFQVGVEQGSRAPDRDDERLHEIAERHGAVKHRA